MSNKTKSKSGGFLVILFLLVVAIICGVLYNLMKKADSFFEDLGGGIGTGSGPVSFSVYQGNDEKELSLNKTGVEIYGTETFTVKQDGDDEVITAKLVPIAMTENYHFKVNNLGYSWNSEIVGFEADLSPYFTIEVNQDENTVAVSGSTLKALEGYAKSENGVASLPGIPSGDMYRLEITSGDETFSCYCSFRSEVEDLTLSKNHISMW